MRVVAVFLHLFSRNVGVVFGTRRWLLAPPPLLDEDIHHAPCTPSGRGDDPRSVSAPDSLASRGTEATKPLHQLQPLWPVDVEQDARTAKYHHLSRRSRGDLSRPAWRLSWDALPRPTIAADRTAAASRSMICDSLSF
ncbi:hypothetical protein Cob_v009790 [Colletotrichum orbiculare MAFF 240422]|uniref:Uncharacterized protein n=1 Tax=Colletotrichum orbiculare (strain 104-T / ATCC 96160 / CBS 514.97 / LARS 414 / MAFF 240422) TaxID=1213857 RepID=A0A484FHR5_COLOR|nr:hypothetical protein Cob_v009790 [Colletotrichum orbiculare MAFF 240422]